MNALLESVVIAVLICGIPFALAGVAAFGEWATRQPEPPRPSLPDDGMDLEIVNDFFHPTGRVSTAVAFARSKSESRGVHAPGPLTSKEIDHAGNTQ